MTATDSLRFYDENAQAFFEATIGIDMTPLYAPLLDALAPGARILDAGCGSGRDAKNFQDLGFQVEAFDASAPLARLAEAHLGKPVRVMRFDEIEWIDFFDGIWACASLLHLTGDPLILALTKLQTSLKVGGYLCASFKFGTGDFEEKGRRFHLQTESSIEEVLSRCSSLRLVRVWQSQNLRPERSSRWLNVLAVRA